MVATWSLSGRAERCPGHSPQKFRIAGIDARPQPPVRSGPPVQEALTTGLSGLARDLNLMNPAIRRAGNLAKQVISLL
eukprot:Skav210719  [mRNA]  locus=scaffold849:84513:84746:- [translate_table: standard]